MGKIKADILLLDLDNTIFDFTGGERKALFKTLSDANANPSPEMMARYSEINNLCWEALERQELNREQVKLHRFELLVQEYHLAADPQRLSVSYEENLGLQHDYLPGAEAFLQAAAERARLYLITNGTSYVARSRIGASNIEQYLSGIFISEEMGADKPSPRYFEEVFRRIDAAEPGGFQKERAVVFGDSLTSDIKGGITAGVTTVWFNPRGKENRTEIRPDYTVAGYDAFLELLSDS